MERVDNMVNSTIDNAAMTDYYEAGDPGIEGEDTSVKLDRLLTIQEICELLKVPKTYIYWLTHRKKIPYIKMQGHLRFRESAIDKWLRSQEVHDAN